MKHAKLVLLGFAALLLFGGVAWFRVAGIDTGYAAAAGGQSVWLLPIITAAALVDSINPCAFSVLVLTISFLFGAGVARGRLMAVGGTYIAGIYVAYLFIGLGILKVLQVFQIPHFMSKVGASALILAALIALAGELFPRFPVKLKIPRASHRPIAKLMERASLPAAFALGALVGMVEFPCTGGPYLLVLGLLHDSQNFIRGLGYLVFYNVLFVLPLVIILLIASDTAVLKKVEAWKKSDAKPARVGGALLMVALGVVLLLL